ncbi:MAG: hypothetical protein N3E47_02720 [Candidatus Bathyarchaeota archaeon]|nr:hypothetical protein [Candidatus Bathyarchaeota archaeon]
MDEISLDGEWDLAYFPEGGVEPEKIVESDGNILDWMKARVPGNCQLDLIREGKLPDPFVGLNTRRFREQEFYEWWYRKKFTLKDDLRGKKLELLFEGVDTFGTIWLNGRLIGETKNMFIPCSFDVTNDVKFGEENILLIRIRSTDLYVRGKDLNGTFDVMNSYERLWARKAAHSFGWDICPRIVTTGLWRPVKIVPHKTPEIIDFFFQVTYADSRLAHIVISVALDLPRENPRGLYLEVHGRCGDSEFYSLTNVLTSCLKIDLDVADPKLWWPRDLGLPNLYDVTLRLIRDGETLDEKHTRVGIRTVKLLQEKQLDGGVSFIFLVNGERVFAKGANWVPADALHGRDMERIPKILSLFSDLNCNMIRVWGGGVYEPDYFYDFCDREGIMVWQDFMFACAIYPQVEEFLNLVKQEAELIVKRLRNHPCIVIWCGDNEVDQMYAALGLDPSENKISRIILKDTCRRLDPTRPYWPSSPHTLFNPMEPNYPLEGDNHIWYHGTYFKAREYSEDRSRFISEIGHLAAPHVDSIKLFISEGKVWPKDEEEWNHHFGTHVDLRFFPQRLRKMEESIRKYFGEIPQNLEDFVLASQIVQAEALKYWIERARQRKFECGGIIWWNIMDCWPQFSDAIVDYYFRKKLAYDYVKRVQRPILISLGEPVENKLPVIIVNDTLTNVDVEFEVEAYDLRGKTLYEGKGYARVPKNWKETVDIVEVSGIGSDLNPPYLFILRLIFNGNVFENHYLYGCIPFRLEDYKIFLQKITALR